MCVFRQKADVDNPCEQPCSDPGSGNPFPLHPWAMNPHPAPPSPLMHCSWTTQGPACTPKFPVEGWKNNLCPPGRQPTGTLASGGFCAEGYVLVLQSTWAALPSCWVFLEHQVHPQTCPLPASASRTQSSPRAPQWQCLRVFPVFPQECGKKAHGVV